MDHFNAEYSNACQNFYEVLKEKHVRGYGLMIFSTILYNETNMQGTEFGLSLSYDIIPAHGGEIKVISTEGKGSEFIVQLS